MTPTDDEMPAPIKLNKDWQCLHCHSRGTLTAKPMGDDDTEYSCSACGNKSIGNEIDWSS